MRAAALKSDELLQSHTDACIETAEEANESDESESSDEEARVAREQGMTFMRSAPIECLRRDCHDKGLDRSGKRSVLIERLSRHMDAQYADTDEQSQDVGGGGSSHVP